MVIVLKSLPNKAVIPALVFFFKDAKFHFNRGIDQNWAAWQLEEIHCTEIDKTSGGAATWKRVSRASYGSIPLTSIFYS